MHHIPKNRNIFRRIIEKQTEGIENQLRNSKEKWMKILTQETSSESECIANFLTKEIGSENKRKFLPYAYGFVGALLLGILLYLIQALGMKSLTQPYTFFLEKWYFILLLLLGFGVQVGLYYAIHKKAKVAPKIVYSSGTVSAGSMIACCMHNFIPLVPVIGFSSVATFFSRYQDYIFSLSILFSFVGIGLMIKKYKDTKMVCHVAT